MKQITWKITCCLLVCLLSRLSYTSQGHLPSSGTTHSGITHSGLSHPHQSFIMKMPTETCLQVNLIEAFSKLLPDDELCQVDKTQTALHVFRNGVALVHLTIILEQINKTYTSKLINVIVPYLSLLLCLPRDHLWATQLPGAKTEK